MTERESPEPASRNVELRHVEAVVHGRHLVRPARRVPEGLVVGFHGFGETAEDNLRELGRVPGLEAWTLASVEALHPFYTRSGDIVSCWMTRRDRELAIRDNLAYVSSVLRDLRDETPDGPLVVAGFSQGTAMAYRAAALGAVPVDAVLALGGDVPPELAELAAVGFAHALIGRGRDDEWYSAGKLAEDVALLSGRGVEPVVYEFDGGHEWTDGFRTEAGRFLRSLDASRAPRME
jgi:predicted esterase